MKAVCLFCGARPGNDPRFVAEAQVFGRGLAQAGLRLVYGGGHVGLMGLAADAALAAGGEVIGVIPQALVDREVAHERVTKLHVTRNMHERKALMADLSDAFVALPGGFGTLDELCEIITWAQLGLHAKPIILLNTAGFYDGFLEFIRTAADSGFIAAEHLQLFRVAKTPEEVLRALSVSSRP
ncbi:MAG: TIGR00730 family Rossman fold protein [Bdellovibrionaceae bacterium]|nr:TIGR00730 family Rossman fold protein [Pseudobdellovibrionaceae bacterium]